MILQDAIEEYLLYLHHERNASGRDGDGRFDFLLNAANADLLRQVEARDGRWLCRRAGSLASQNIEGHDVTPTVVHLDGTASRTSSGAPRMATSTSFATRARVGDPASRRSVTLSLLETPAKLVKLYDYARSPIIDYARRRGLGGNLMGAKTPLGPLELEILEWVQDHAPATVRMAAEHFNRERKLARTTVLTILERLRKKGYLERRRADGVYEYSHSAPRSEVQSALVGDFIRTMLGDSLTPFVAYLSRKGQVSEAELGELKRLVQALDERREGEPRP